MKALFEFIFILASMTSIVSYLILALFVTDKLKTIENMTTELLEHNFGDSEEEESDNVN